MRFLFPIIVIIGLTSCGGSDREEVKSEEIKSEGNPIQNIQTPKFRVVCDTVPVYYLDPITGNIKIEDEIDCDTIPN